MVTLQEFKSVMVAMFREMNEKMSLRSERIDAVNKYYGNEQEAFNKYRKEVSDHVPVALTINLKKN